MPEIVEIKLINGFLFIKDNKGENHIISSKRIVYFGKDSCGYMTIHTEYMQFDSTIPFNSFFDQHMNNNKGDLLEELKELKDELLAIRERLDKFEVDAEYFPGNDKSVKTEEKLKSRTAK